MVESIVIKYQPFICIYLCPTAPTKSNSVHTGAKSLPALGAGPAGRSFHLAVGRSAVSAFRSSVPLVCRSKCRQTLRCHLTPNCSHRVVCQRTGFYSLNHQNKEFCGMKGARWRELRFLASISQRCPSARPPAHPTPPTQVLNIG